MKNTKYAICIIRIICIEKINNLWKVLIIYNWYFYKICNLHNSYNLHRKVSILYITYIIYKLFIYM